MDQWLLKSPPLINKLHTLGYKLKSISNRNLGHVILVGWKVSQLPANARVCLDFEPEVPQVKETLPESILIRNHLTVYSQKDQSKSR